MTVLEKSRALMLPVEGMTCELCVSRIDTALRTVPGVTDVAVDLKAARVFLRSSRLDIDTPRIGQAVHRAGFLPGLVTTHFLVGGLNCPTCVTRVERAIRAIRGVVRVDVSLATGRARVEAGATVPASAIVRAIEAAGHKAARTVSIPPVSPGAALAAALSRVRRFGTRPGIRGRAAAAAI